MDNQPVPDPRRWLGLVVPKRHARRAVTRNQIKRASRDMAARFETSLPPGMWLVRLRAAVDTARYRSAWSDALGMQVRGELEQLFRRAAR